MAYVALFGTTRALCTRPRRDAWPYRWLKGGNESQRTVKSKPMEKTRQDNKDTRKLYKSNLEIGLGFKRFFGRVTYLCQFFLFLLVFFSIENRFEFKFPVLLVFLVSILFLSLTLSVVSPWRGITPDSDTSTFRKTSGNFVWTQVVSDVTCVLSRSPNP